EGNAFGWCEMQAEDIDSAGLESSRDALQMSERLFFAQQVAKAVDHVERGIDWPRQLEVGHVSNEHGRVLVAAGESFVAVIDGSRIEVEAGHVIAGQSEAKEQPAGAA